MHVLVVKGKTLLKGAITVLFVLCAVLFGVWLSKTADASTQTSGKVQTMPVVRVNTAERKLALTIECYGQCDELGRMLDLLDTYKVKASFFITGDFATQDKAKVLEIKGRGHEIYQLSDTKEAMKGITREKAIERYKAGESALSTVTTPTGKLVGIPRGEFTTGVLEAAHSLGYTAVRYTVDLQSIYDKDSSILSDHLNPYIGSGAIIRHGLDVPTPTITLSEVLSQVRDQGYTIVPLGQLLYQNGRIDDEGIMHEK